MKKIELSFYEINDLVRILDYALEKKKEDYKNKLIQERKYILDIENIKILRQLLLKK